MYTNFQLRARTWGLPFVVFDKDGAVYLHICICLFNDEALMRFFFSLYNFMLYLPTCMPFVDEGLMMCCFPFHINFYIIHIRAFLGQLERPKTDILLLTSKRPGKRNSSNNSNNSGEQYGSSNYSSIKCTSDFPESIPRVIVITTLTIYTALGFGINTAFLHPT